MFRDSFSPPPLKKVSKMKEKIEISKEIEFDAGHRVSTHASKCKNPHGHRYKIRVTCRGSIIDDASRPDHGMLIDFGNLKNIMNEKIHDVLDHGFIVWKKDFPMRDALSVGQNDYDLVWNVILFDTMPTAENIAVWAWQQIQNDIRDQFGDDLELSEVAVWETPTSVAYYRGEH